MSQAHDSPTPAISEMPPWAFWTRSHLNVGLSVEDADAIANGTADAAQLNRAGAYLNLARNALIQAEAGTPMGRPS